jgi:hypothetical protein
VSTPGGAAPRGSALSCGRRACDRTRLESPCTSGTVALAIRAQRGVPTASLSLGGPTGAGIAHPAPPDTSGTTHRATERDRSSRPLTEPNVLADDVMLLCSAGIGRTQRSAGDRPGQTNVGPGNAPMQRHDVQRHDAVTVATAAVGRDDRSASSGCRHIPGSGGRVFGWSCRPGELWGLWPEDVCDADEFDDVSDLAGEVGIDAQLPPVVGGVVEVDDE